MVEDIHYDRARRERYLQEIGVAQQLGAITDELSAMRAYLEDANYTGAISFTDLCNRIDAIKAEIPKS